jgi:hypothetical protein
MRTKLIIIATALVVLALGATVSNAALQNAVQVKINFKKAGGPGSLTLQLANMDGSPLPEGKPMSFNSLKEWLLCEGVQPRGGCEARAGVGRVPQRVSKLIVSSPSAKYNSKALPYCKVIFNGQDKIPTKADGITGAEGSLTPRPGKSATADAKKNCPLKSVLGTGEFSAVIGTVGAQYDQSISGAIMGTVTAYNYKPRSGDQFGAVVRLDTTIPVESTLYIYTGVSRSGVLTASVPSRAEIPSNLDGAIPDGQVVMTGMNLNLKAPKPPKKKKPIFTVKSFSNLSVYGQLVRENP